MTLLSQIVDDRQQETTVHSPNSNNDGEVDRKSQTSNSDNVVVELPWDSVKISLSKVDVAIYPNYFIIKSLLSEIFGYLERKLTTFDDDDNQDKPLNKHFCLADDSHSDNLLKVLSAFCEHCLPSVLSTLIEWYEKQLKLLGDDSLNHTERRRLAVNFCFCVLLIEVLPQIHYYPESCEQSVSYVINLAFKEVSHRDPLSVGVKYNNFVIVAERYAEVLGVLSQTHGVVIQKTFLSILNEFRRESSPSAATVNNIIALLMSMKFYRIKTNQICDFEAGIRFLDELGQYFLDTKQKDVKHAVAGLLVEILIPVAAQIKTEVNIPALISFVDKLYAPTFELVSKKRDKMAAYPLLTCLLCISQSKFFLANWIQFLNSTLASLKSKDSKVSRVALESLYRLLWVYVIRNNCEGNIATRNRLESICNSLFPKGNRAIIPRDAPLNIFVKIIHFIAQQKLDYAFKEIIFDLLGCCRANNSLKTPLYPERMNIGIRALMVIANGLEQKEGPPDMPRSMATNTTNRMKKTYIICPLTADIARSIGLEQYYAPCRKAFDNILRTLDSQVGKSLMITAVQARGKEPDELLTSEVKPKLDLFRTCIAAIPRLLPDSMTHSELVELMSRLTLHIDEELRIHAAQTLQTLMSECLDWRDDIIHVYLSFISNQIPDSYPFFLDSSLRLLHQLIFTWKTAISNEKKQQVVGVNAKENCFSTSLRMQISPLLTNSVALALHSVEGLCLAMLCQFRTQSRKFAINILKEVRQLLYIVTPNQHDKPVIEVLDDATSYVYGKYIEHVSISERQFWNTDLATASDKIGSLETDNCLVNSDRGNEYFRWDPWACALSGYCEHQFLISKCPVAVFYAWPVVNIRLNVCSNFIDPSNPQNENRASLLRNSKSKGTNFGESFKQDSYLSLWQKYLVMASALAPHPHDSMNSFSKGFSPTSSLENDMFRSFTSLRTQKTSVHMGFYQKLVLLLRWEQMVDMRDSVVLGIGSINPFSFDCLLDEMKSVLREVMEKKAENNARRRKRKDLLRLQLIRIFQVAVFRGVLSCSGCVDFESGLCSSLVDFIDSMRQNLESDQDRDLTLLTNLRLHFAKTISLIIHSIPADKRANLLTNEKKQSLFFLFTSWCSRSIASSDRKRGGDVGTYVEQRAIEAMCALLCCGPIFETIKAIGEDGYLYGWLETLLVSTNSTVEKFVEQTINVMLDLNDETPQLLEWAINICYSKPSKVAAKCFKSLIMLLSKREYPCEFDSIFVLCQMMLADCDAYISESAVELLHLLRRQFLDDSVSSFSQQLADINYFSINQIEICRFLAKSYPKITVSVFSEICGRIENASVNRVSSMLTVLLPWIENIQLIHQQDELQSKSPNETHGWGSLESTQLILNNLLHMTCTQSEAHSVKISCLWRSLANSCPSNLSVIVEYLFTMVILSPEILMQHTKRVICFLMKSCADLLVSILIEQLINVNEQFKANLERCELPPYYRYHGNCSDQYEKLSENAVDDSTELSIDNTELQTASISFGSSCSSDKAAKQVNTTDEDVSSYIFELPMPAYGGYYCPLSKFLPPVTQPLAYFSKSNLALLHICNALRCSLHFDWNQHIPLLLHVAVVGLDSLRSTICRHSRQTIVNIVLLSVKENVNAPNFSNIMLNNRVASADCGNILMKDVSSCEPAVRVETPIQLEKNPAEYRQMLIKSDAVFCSKTELIQAIMFCMSEKMDRPFWANEDITPKQWKIESADHLGCLVQHLAELLLDDIPQLAVQWTQVAMSMALSTSNRHIAGRCFQIASALCQSPSPWIPGMLSRLVETVGEAHDETQSYVTDILLCLHAAVAFFAQRNLTSTQALTHNRSTSYTPALLQQIALTNVSPNAVQATPQNRKENRHSMLLSENTEPASVGLCRSKSATALKGDLPAEEDLSSLCQLFFISVALLESINDNEYLLALHLLDKIFDAAGSDCAVCLQRFNKIISQFDWCGFSGLVGLIMKGFLMNNGYELSLVLLMKCLDHINEPVMGDKNAIPLIITASLPLLLLHYDAPTPLCTHIAKSLSEHLAGKVDRLDDANSTDDPIVHLVSMMTVYVMRSFTRDRFHWAKCVCKYFCDAFLPDITRLITVLSEMLELLTTSCFHQMLIMHIMYVLITHYNDISNRSCVIINSQVVRNVSKHLQGPNWKEAQRVLKAFMQFSYSLNEDSSEGKGINGSLHAEVAIRDCVNTSPICKNGIDSLSTRKHSSLGKVRERLVTLLNASGLRVGLPKSASVIFSQSLHDVACEPSASLSSSTEKVPLLHAVGDLETTSSSAAPDQSLTDSFPRVFREFDFLEAEQDSISESAESCFNWLATMRPHSISRIDIGSGVPYHDNDTVEIANDERHSNASDSIDISSERTPLPSEVRSGSSSSEVESCVDEIDEEEEDEEEFPAAEISDRVVDVTSHADSTQFSQSETSFEVPHLPSLFHFRLFLECNHHSSSQSEQQWLNCLSELANDTSGDLTSHTILVFSQLYRDCCNKLASLLRDVSHILSSSLSEDISIYLSDALNTIIKITDGCSFLFVSPIFLRTHGLLSDEKCNLFELQEHYETFIERKEQCIRCLNTVKAAQKLMMIGGASLYQNNNQNLELCKSVYKLFFQLLLMSNKYDEMIRYIENVPDSEDSNVSSDILNLHRCLLASISDNITTTVAAPIITSVSIAPTTTMISVADSSILNALYNREYKNSTCILRQLRQDFGTQSEFGCCDQVDVEILLLLYCRNITTNSWAIVSGNHKDFTSSCKELKRTNVKLLSAVRLHLSDTKSSRDSFSRN